VLELIWRTPKPADRLEDGCLLAWVTSVDQCQPVVALDQEGVCHPHRDDVNASITRFTDMGKTLRVNLPSRIGWR